MTKKNKTRRIELERLVVTGLRLTNNDTPDNVDLRLPEAYGFPAATTSVPTYNLDPDDIDALRDAMLADSESVRIVLEVDEE